MVAPEDAPGSQDESHPDRTEREFSRRDVLRTVVALSALALPFVSACRATNGQPGRRNAPPSTIGQVASPRGPTDTIPSTTMEGRGPLGSGRPVTFAFAGDTHFVDQWDTEGGVDYTGIPVLADQLRADPTGLLAPITPVLSGADLAMVNLETAITERGTPVAGKAFHFRSPSESFVALKSAGVDVVNMANNHALDYGPLGMEDTFDAIATSGVPVVGIGHDATEAYRPYRTVINGQRIAIFGAVDWLEPALVSRWTATDTQPGLAFSIYPARLLSAVTAARPEVDTLIVFLHWGIEQTHCASPEQHTLAQSLVQAAPTSLSGVMRTGCSGPAAWALRWSPTGWATSCTGAKMVTPAAVGCSSSRPLAGASTRTRGSLPV